MEWLSLSWFEAAMLKVFLFVPWLVLIEGPLKIIQILLDTGSNHASVFDYLSSNALTHLIFGDFASDPLNTKNLPHFFVALSIIAIGLILIMFLMQLIIIQFTETHTIREKLGKAIKNSFLAFAVIVFIPLFMSLINYLMTGLLQVLKITAFGKNGSLADTLWGIGADSKQTIIDHVPGDFRMPSIDQLQKWNLILEFIAVLFTLYVLFIAAMTLVERIIDLLLLFTIAPIVAAMMPVDQGKRLGVWREMTIGKFIIGPGTILPIYLFLEILPKAIVDVDNNNNFSWFEKQILYGLFCTAGAISCLKTQKIINHLVTQNLGVQSAIDSNGAAIAGSIAGKARGFASLVGGGFSAAKLGKQVLFGGAQDKLNADGTVDVNNKANSLLKNGIFKSGFNVGKGAVGGVTRGLGHWGRVAEEKGGGFGGYAKAPFAGAGRLARNAWDNAGEGLTNMWNDAGQFFHDNYNNARYPNAGGGDDVPPAGNGGNGNNEGNNNGN